MSLLRRLASQVAFALFAFAHGQLQARNKLPIGADLCVVIINRASYNADTEPSVIPDTVTLTPGWALGPKGTGDTLRVHFEKSIQRATAEGKTEEDAVIDFLQRHAYLNPQSLREKIQPPSAPDRGVLLNIQSIVNRVNVERLVEEFSRSAKKTVDDDKDLAIISALKNLERGSALSADDVTAIGRLYTKIRELPDRAEKLKSLLGSEGQADFMTWQYLKAHNKAFIAKILASVPGENLYIAYPQVHNETKKLFIDVKKVTDLIDYQAFYEEVSRRGTKVKEYKEQLQTYAWDYVRYVHLATRLKAIQDKTITFRVSDSRKSEEVIKKEDENERFFATYKQGILGGIEHTQPIHPDPKILLSESRWSGFRANRYFAGRHWRNMIAFILTFILIPTNISIFWDTWIQDRLVVSALEQSNALNEAWWIAKCSAERNKEKITECLKRWGSAAGKTLAEQVRARKLTNPNYTGVEELKLIKDMSERIVVKTFERAGFEAMSGVQIEYDLLWLPQKLYSNLQKEFEQMERAASAHAPAPKFDPNAPDAPSGEASVDNAKGRIMWPKDEAQMEVDKLRNTFITRSASLEGELSALKDDPRKQAEILFNYTKATSYLLFRLESFEALEYGKEFSARVIALKEQAEDELNRAQLKSLELIPALKEVKQPKPKPSSQLPPVEPVQKPSRAPSSELTPGDNGIAPAPFGYQLMPFE